MKTFQNFANSSNSQMCQNIKLAFRKNYSFSLISFFALMIILNVSYFVLAFVSTFLSRVPFLVYPLLFLFAYFSFSMIFGFHFLIFNLYSNERTIFGQLFKFLSDVRMIYVTLFYLLSAFILLFVSFIPYYFFADKMLDKEIYGLFLAQDVSAILKLEHGFSKDFLLSCALWGFLYFIFLFSFVFFPFYLGQNKSGSFFHFAKKSLASVYNDGRFLKIVVVCIRSVLLPFAIFVVSFALSCVLLKFKMSNLAEIFRFISVISILFAYFYFLYAASSLYATKDSTEQKIYLLPPPPEYDSEA